MVRVDDRREVVGVFGVSFVSKLLTYFLLLVLGNLYLVEDYGASTFAFGVFNIVLFFSLVGLPDTMVPWIIQRRDYRSILYFLLSLNVLVCGAGLFVAFYHPWLLPLVLFYPFSLLSAFGRVFLRIQHRYRLIQWLSALFVGMQLVCCLFLLVVWVLFWVLLWLFLLMLSFLVGLLVRKCFLRLSIFLLIFVLFVIF